MVTTTKGAEKMEVKEEEMKKAIETINKNKAIGIDNLTLKPLDKKEMLKYKINGLDYHESRKELEIKISKKE